MDRTKHGKTPADQTKPVTRQNSYRRYLPVAIISVCIVLFIFLVFNGKSKQQEEPRELAWRVNTQIAKPQSAQPTLILHGVTESPQEAKLRAAITADVVATPAAEGRVVEQGDLLIKLDDRETRFIFEERKASVSEFNAQINAEKARFAADKKSLAHEQELLSLSERDVSRQQTLFKDKLGSESALDEARKNLQQARLAVTNRQLAVNDHANRLAQLQAKLANAKAQLAKAQLDLSRTNVYAPFAGRVTQLFVAVGDRVQPGNELVDLFDVKNIEVRAQIPADLVSTISDALANKEKITARGKLDGVALDLQLNRLAGQVQNNRGGVDGLFYIEQNTANIVLGRAFELTVQLPSVADVYLIPSAALYGTDKIYLVKDERMQAITVTRIGTIHNTSNDQLLIKSKQLTPGDIIITTQLPNARSGLKVITEP